MGGKEIGGDISLKIISGVTLVKNHMDVPFVERFLGIKSDLTKM